MVLGCFCYDLFPESAMTKTKGGGNTCGPYLRLALFRARLRSRPFVSFDIHGLGSRLFAGPCGPTDNLFGHNSLLPIPAKLPCRSSNPTSGKEGPKNRCPAVVFITFPPTSKWATQDLNLRPQQCERRLTTRCNCTNCSGQRHFFTSPNDTPRSLLRDIRTARTWRHVARQLAFFERSTA